MKEMKYLRNILKDPPMKAIKCRTCGGRGYINPRGMITSDDCPTCGNDYSAEDYHKEYVEDYDEFERMVREAVMAEVKAK